ncbi:MAG: ABC transporter ATP-binding protein [Acidobacteria bacterium]|nr:ABC transporter ATP-binding protein [Acidobacteriota bacterium]
MLEAQRLTKYFSRRPVVKDVSFIIRPHEIVGYLGPNGAGKSTTVKMLVGLIKPSGGEILFEGHPVEEQIIEYKMRLGYVPEEALLYSHLSGREYLQLAGRLRSIPENMLNPKVDELLRLFSLSVAKYSPISSYSKGMKQKIMMIAALLHNPDILLFDEPLSGLDVSSILIVRSLLRSLAAQGKAVLYSSHVLEVVEKICGRVLIIHKGSLVADDSVENLRRLMQTPSLEEIFTQLVQNEDTEQIAHKMVAVIQN